MALPQLTLGIEEEYQIIDPNTRLLANASAELVEKGQTLLDDQVKPEFMQSQIEIGTKVCADIREARSEIVRLRRIIHGLCRDNGLAMAAASTHPISRWSEQQVTEAERYSQFAADRRDVARRLLIFGMHVHVGIEDPELRIDVLSQSVYFLPHLLALSTSSPFFVGRDTGMKSYRSVIFENMPRSGLPPRFEAWHQYEEFIDTLIKCGVIDEPTKIWWDVRPHPKFPTIEFRIADVCTRVDEAICLAALLQALVAKLIQLRQANQAWRPYSSHLVAENKWRALRYGLDGKMIDFGKKEQVPTRFLILELFDFVDDVVDELGTRQEVEYLHTILDNGSSADRQLRAYRENGDSLEAVVDNLLAESIEGCEPE